MLKFVLAVLATWRVTHLLANEDGPADIIVRFRALLGNSLAGKMMDCFNCLSIWIAAPAALFVSLKPVEWFMSWLALSGGACLLERLVREPVTMLPMQPPAERDFDDVLRSETLTVQGHSDPDADTDPASVRSHE
jgi:hypothetical protein